MSDAILVLNAGSSSLKFSAFAIEQDLNLLARGQVEGIGTKPHFVLHDASGELAEEQTLASADHDDSLAVILERLQARLTSRRLAAVGHRVVHGGVDFTSPVRIDDAILASLQALVPLAPLHQPHNLAAIVAVRKRAPNLPQVACFDTAFHRTQPEVAQRFALPPRFVDIRRYGFHGISYEYIASVLPGHDAKAAQGRTIVAHLGNGASLCAMQSCRSIATTMSFTPLDGLVMGTRVGSLDPGVVLHLLNQMSAKDVEHLLYHESGLLGVSGISSDMRALLSSPDPRAAGAIDLFVYRIGREIGSLAAALGGLDALVFTGGIGENAAVIRDRVRADAAWLGAFTVLVIPTNEELMIAQHTRRVLALP